jgi:beta-lactamase regulating signal transducer with metallopeptidase domain
MNAWPSLNEWARFGNVLALELVVVFAVAKLISLRLRSATWRRALWQMTLLALLLVTLGELNGVRGWLRLPEKKAAPLSERKVVVTLQDAEPDWALFRDQLASEAAPLATAVPKPAPPPSRWQQHTGWPALAWAVVAALILFRLLIAQVMAFALRVGSRRRSGQPCPLNVINAGETADMAVRSSNAVAARAQSIAQSLGIRRPVALLANARAVVPFTFGVWRPVIVLPRHFTSVFTPDQQDAALAHELAHVAGLDSAWRVVSQLACAVLWWHPLAWLAKRELDHASELVADEASLLVANGPDRLAECLVACAKELRRPALASWLGMDGGGFRSALGKRVTRLLQLNPHARLSRPVPWYLRLLAPVVCVALLWLGMAAVMKTGEPRSSAWRASILGSAFAAAAENKALIASPQPVQAKAAAQPTILLKRSFNVDSNTLFQALQIIADRQAISEGLPTSPVSPRNNMSTLRSFFMAAGIKLAEPGCTIALEDIGKSLRLTVRATPEELDLVEKTLPTGNAPNARDARPAAISPKRQAIYDKLRSTRLNEWGPLDNLPLNEVIRALSAESRRIDPETKGVNFIISGNAVPNPGVVDPNRLPIARTNEPVDLKDMVIRLGTAIKNPTLEEVLNIVVKIADKKIKYSVEDYGVLISPAGNEPTPLHTRFFHMGSNDFQRALQSMPQELTNSSAQTPSSQRAQASGTNGLSLLSEPTAAEKVIPVVQSWFKSVGVELTQPGKSVFYNDKLGMLMVRATLEDLDTIEKALQPFGVKSGTGFSEVMQLEAARLVQAGKSFYENGQLQAARTNLQAALRFSPTNQGALYYLDLVNTRESAARARLQEIEQKKMLMNTPPNQVPEASATNLQTRLFRIDPHTILQELEAMHILPPDRTRGSGTLATNATGGVRFKLTVPPTNLAPVLKLFFEKAGTDINGPGRSVIYNDRVETVMVRATEAELNTIEKALQFVNMTPPQLTIRVKVLEVERKGSDGLGFL